MNTQGTPIPPAQALAAVKILIADDTPLLLDMLEKGLRELGFLHITRALDGNRALAEAADLEPDLVFLDIEMPRRNGIDTLRGLKAARPDLFVCMLSSHTSVQNVRAALAAGASGFLVKPLDQDRLAHVVGQFLRRGQWLESAGT